MLTPEQASSRHGGGTRDSAASVWRLWAAIPAGFFAGSIPFSYLAARRLRGVDLRTVGNGTVSGTALHDVAGFKALAVVGILEVAKGSVGPLLAWPGRPALSAAAGGAAVAGHDWSPWLRGAGGRGLSPAIGALGVTAPAAAATLLAGMSAGRLAGQTALATLIAATAAVPVAARLGGPAAGWAAAAALAPMIVKRLCGNSAASTDRPATLWWRLLFDRDTRRPGPVAKTAGRRGRR